MLKLPYAVQYIDSAPTDAWFTNYLNTQWKEGWEYVAHLTVPGPRQGLLMKKRNYPEPYKVTFSSGETVEISDELLAVLEEEAKGSRK